MSLKVLRHKKFIEGKKVMEKKEVLMPIKPAVSRHVIYQQVSDETNITVESVQYICDAMFDAIAASLQNCQPVRVKNFGIFEIKTMKERLSRKPITNEQIVAKAKNLPTFRYSEGLKELVSDATILRDEDL